MDIANIIVTKGVELLVGYGPRFLLALVTLIVGLWIIKGISKSIAKVLDKRDVDISLKPFLISITSILLKILLLLTVVSMIGVKATSFIAVLGAAGLAVGLALQGSLSNFAGGVLILLFKPFKVGDFIEAQGHLGKVHEIVIINTILKTPDNKTIILPNGALAGSSVVNYSTEQQRRVDMVFGIGYGDDIAKAKSILKQLISEDERVLKEPEPMIVLSELADSSVNFAVRAWCNGADYWNIYFDFQEKVKLTFDREGVSIPFPQRDVHLIRE